MTNWEIFFTIVLFLTVFKQSNAINNLNNRIEELEEKINNDDEEEETWNNMDSYDLNEDKNDG